MRDDYYVESTEDILVGSWYGPGSYGDSYGRSYDTDDYVYIESLGGNKYKLTSRFILASDKSSQCFTEQYGYFDESTNTLKVEQSYTTYGETGIFVGRGSYAYEGTYYLDREKMRLYWNEYGSSNYRDKY